MILNLISSSLIEIYQALVRVPKLHRGQDFDPRSPRFFFFWNVAQGQSKMYKLSEGVDGGQDGVIKDDSPCFEVVARQIYLGNEMDCNPIGESFVSPGLTCLWTCGKKRRVTNAPDIFRFLSL